MRKYIITGLIGLLAGLAIGFFAANTVKPVADVSQIAAAEPVPLPINPPAAPTGQTGPSKDVAAVLERADKEPNNSAAQLEAGHMYAKAGSFEKAVEFFEKGVALDPGNLQANVVLANAYFDLRRFEDAERVYNKALEIDPQDVNSRTDIGRIYVERPVPDYDRAIKEFEAALSIDASHEPTLYYLGLAYFRKGDVENAKAALERLKTANPASDLVARLSANMDSK